MRATYKSEADFKEEGTLKSVTNTEVSYEEAQQNRPSRPGSSL
jgi:hypothetical protein